MALRLAIIGPGRVGRALGRRWAEGGIELLGFLGRDPSTATEASHFCGAGQVLGGLPSLAAADAVALCVQDDHLEELALRLARAGPRPGSLYLHCSGRFGLEVLAELSARGAQVGALHPLCPFPDAETGYQLLPGKTAVVEGDSPLLFDLARRAGLDPLAITTGERGVYHAACALAANGLTALNDVTRRLFLLHGGMDEAAARRLACELMGTALDACVQRGPQDALSGPVLRGDRETVQAHLGSLRAVAPQTLATYLALMRHAVDLARMRDLREADARALIDLFDAEAARG